MYIFSVILTVFKGVNIYKVFIKIQILFGSSYVIIDA